MLRRFKYLLAPLVALVLILAGCGDGEEAGGTGGGKSSGNGIAIDDPNAAVLAAFSELNPTTVDISFKLDATADQLAQAMEAELSGDPSEQLMLDLMTQAEMRVVSSDQAMAMEMAIDGSTLFEFRTIAQTIYVRLDVDSVVALANQIDPAAGAELSSQIDMVPAMFGGDPSMSFLGDLLSGGWVSLELPPDSELGGMWESSTEPDQLNADFAAALQQIVDENTSVTAAGEARGGDRFLVEVQVADLLAALQSHPVTAEALELSDPDADIDDILAEMRQEGVSEVWELDVVLIDGNISSIRADMAQMTTELPEGSTLPWLITFNSSPTAPTAPADHTPVPAELLNQMFSGMMAGA